MKYYQDKRGFSLVEMIIVIAILSIMTGGVFATFGYLNKGKTKKAAAALDSKLKYIQTQTMTQKGVTYLYIYKHDDTVYTCSANEDDTDGNGTIDESERRNFVSRTELNGYLPDHAGSELCGSKVNVSGIGGSTLTLDENNMIKICYSKATGAFKCCNDGDDSSSVFYNTIELKGSETFSVKLIEKTGKHFVKS